ncbi:MAG: hypothetical protein Q8Q49_02455, partial [bacterium]|nr:hypothetical protein [bacterium]
MNKKVLSFILAMTLTFMPLGGSIGAAFADDVPVAPSVPETPTTQETPSDAPVAPSAPPTPNSSTQDQTTTQGTGDQTTEQTQDQQTKKRQASSEDQQSTQTQQATAPSTTQGGGNIGTTGIATGDANNQGTLLTAGNNNLTNTGQDGSFVGLGGVVNAGNGSGSTNDASTTSTSNDLTNQTNSAGVDNTMDLDSLTGSNTSIGNVGDTSMVTGDANVSGTAITAVNTNIDGVAVSQFDVVDDQKGDLVLNFADGCISGCGVFGQNVSNTGNGSDSTNNATSSTN